MQILQKLLFGFVAQEFLTKTEQFFFNVPFFRLLSRFISKVPHNVFTAFSNTTFMRLFLLTSPILINDLIQLSVIFVNLLTF